MAIAKLTMIGLHEWMLDHNDDLFRDLTIPAGIDKTTLVNNILMRGGEFEVLYSNPYFMQTIIGTWSSKWQRTMEKWLAALSIEYDPLNNYDRTEIYTDIRSEGEKTSNTMKENGALSSNEGNTGSESIKREENALGTDSSDSEGDGSSTNTVSAYDASDYQAHDKNESANHGTNISNSLTSAQGETTRDTSDDKTRNDFTYKDADSNTDRSLESSIEHSAHLYGNIGVTTSQQMLESELDIAKWNLYEQITDLFLNEFCIYVY